MKKCIILPDSFKGTMDSIEVCGIIKAAILGKYPGCEITAIPVADGGEGTVDCFALALGCEKVKIQVKGPFMEEIDAIYARKGDMAILEMAAAAGLPMATGRLNPETATTYGVGMLIKDAVDKGCKKIILGLGGSCTNDGGAGAAAAMGTKFYNDDGEEFIPTGGTLGMVKKIDNRQSKDQLADVEVIAMCDIDNPMYGEKGAAYIFAPQKGADSQMVKRLDWQLRLFSEAITTSLGIDVSCMPGSGAAGAMGAGVKAFFGAELKKGIDTVLDLIEYEALLSGCDWVFTGEGKLDRQSISGKVVMGVANRAKAKGVPVVAVVGIRDEDLTERELLEAGIVRVVQADPGRADFAQIKYHCREDLKTAMEEFLVDFSEENG